jgi:hypothetical protein
MRKPAIETHPPALIPVVSAFIRPGFSTKVNLCGNLICDPRGIAANDRLYLGSSAVSVRFT